jgi:DNA helicase-2/ATP-dependent DNA helicase PcrA
MNYTATQIEAINCLDQNLQIIACAGSGKTQVISQRIVNLIQHGTPPAQIIAFTYTEKAAGELQARILKLCREQLPEQHGIAEMYVGTIHAWCLNVLQQYRYDYQKYRVLDEIKLKLFIDRYYNLAGMKGLEMARFTDTGHFIALMGILREAEFQDRDSVPHRYWDALEQYETFLRQHCYLDFTMIMTEVIRFLRDDPAFRSRIQKIAGYLIVDEYQDVNPTQEAIVQELFNLGANICVVGDDDQTIFQWRGSSIHYIQNFTSRYPNVRQIILDDNFRSSNAVVDVALSCITNNAHRLPKQMKAKGHQKYDKGDVLYNQYTSVEEENAAIVQTIQNLHGHEFQDKPGADPRGLDYADVVILLRRWSKADAITQALQAANIPYIVTGLKNLFDRPEVHACRGIFQYLSGEWNEETLVGVWQDLSPKITAEAVGRGVAYLKTKHPSINKYFEAFIIQEIFQEFLDKAGIHEYVFQDAAGANNLVGGYQDEEVVFYNMGMFSQIIDDFETIHFKSEPQRKLLDFLSFLRYTAEDYYPEGWLNNTYRSPNAVQIMTVYQAKGLEYPVVFVPGLNQNYLPSQRFGGKSVWSFFDKELISDVSRYFPATEDERRLLYVAITRSKKFLWISRAPDTRNTKKESIFGPEIRRSNYIFESPQRDYSERPKTTPQPSFGTANIVLTFSLLKNFFDCPYSFKFYSFYGFRPALSARLGFGASIHNALMEIHREYLEGKVVQPNELNPVLDHHINFPYASEPIREQMTARAQKSVAIYYDTNAHDFPSIEFAEKEIQLDLGDGILVNGKMDLIKKKNLDGTEERTIIDFKSTEDAQSYNATKDQLQLYALGYLQLTGANADFLQVYNLDSNDGKKFELTAGQLTVIEQRIRDAANDIRSNRLNHTCNDPQCVCRFKTAKASATTVA